jgi:hypothetical protein
MKSRRNYKNSIRCPVYKVKCFTALPKADFTFRNTEALNMDFSHSIYLVSHHTKSQVTLHGLYKILLKLENRIVRDKQLLLVG